MTGGKSWMAGARGVMVERLLEPTAAERDAVIAIEAGAFANPWTAETFDRMLTTAVSHVYIARSPEGGIVAFCGCWVIEREVHINTLAVDAAWRRRGIASTLLEAVLRLTSAERATLEVRRSNAAAIGLYRKFGFEVTAVRPKYYGDPEEDGLILWLNP